MEVTFHKEMRRYKLLHHLPFDPTRKRMSVVIKDEKGYCQILICFSTFFLKAQNEMILDKENI